MKPDKGDWLAIVNVFAANGLGEACLSPFRLASLGGAHRLQPFGELCTNPRITPMAVSRITPMVVHS